MSALSEAWTLLKDTILSFIDDEALSRGAAIAFYTVTSIAPVLLIVIAIAGLAFGRDAAQNAIIAQLSGLMGPQTAEVLQSAVASAAGKSSGIMATIVGIITLIATASGVFGEMQSALNAIWKAKPKGTTVSRLIRDSSALIFCTVPVRLDDAVIDTSEAWAGKLSDQRHIGDFRHSIDHDGYRQSFERVLRDLKQRTEPAK
jgi:uncharacterized BrkB/YihY/UPF0761 family membrane protein